MNLLKEMLRSFSKEQIASLKKIGKLIVEDSVLQITGLFKSFD